MAAQNPSNRKRDIEHAVQQQAKLAEDPCIRAFMMRINPRMVEVSHGVVWHDRGMLLVWLLGWFSGSLVDEWAKLGANFVHGLAGNVFVFQMYWCDWWNFSSGVPLHWGNRKLMSSICAQSCF